MLDSLERELILARLVLIHDDIKNLRDHSMTSMIEGFTNDLIADELEEIVTDFETILTHK